MHCNYKLVRISLGLLVIAVGCEATTLDKQAEQVRDQSQRQADQMRQSSQDQADAIRNRADQQANEKEAQADQIEDKGERAADAIERKGERVADEMEAINAYWREHYKSRPYVKSNIAYSTYRDAYLFGYKAKKKHVGKTVDQVMTDLERDWNRLRTETQLTWEEAKEAIRDGYEVDYTQR